MATVVVMTKGVGVGGRVGAGVSVLGMSVEVWRKDREGTRSGVRTIKTKGRRRRRQTLSPRAPSLGRRTEEDSPKKSEGYGAGGWPVQAKVCWLDKDSQQGEPLCVEEGQGWQVWKAWNAERGWLQSPGVRVNVHHSGPDSRKPIPYVLSQGRSQQSVSQPGRSQRRSGRSSWPGQLQRNWVKGAQQVMGAQVKVKEGAEKG